MPLRAVRREAFGRSEQEVARDPRLRAEYELRTEELPEAGCWLNLFVRREAPGIVPETDPDGVPNPDKAGDG